MDFVSRHFIALNATVVILLCISFLRMRTSSRQKLMRLRERPQTQVIIKRTEIDGDDPRALKPTGPKALNVMFNYNGHSWDAYEVLGVPAGSDFEKSFLAYEQLTKNMDAESREFMLAALEAIRQTRQYDE